MPGQMENAAPSQWTERRLYAPYGLGYGRLGRAVLALFLALFGLVAQWPSLVGGRIFHLAIDGAAFVVLGEIFCDGQTVLINEE